MEVLQKKSPCFFGGLLRLISERQGLEGQGMGESLSLWTNYFVDISELL